jgi:hypothetical protein
MPLGNKWQVVQRVDGRLEIRLRMTELPKNGATIHAIRHMIVVVGLVRESSFVQEYILQTLAAFGLWVHPDWGTLMLSLHAHAKNGGTHARYPAARE